MLAACCDARTRGFPHNWNRNAPARPCVLYERIRLLIIWLPDQMPARSPARSCVQKLKTSQVAELLGVNVETLRYYERIELIPNPQRTAGGHRKYSETDLAQVQLVRRARLIGFGLEEIRALLNLANSANRLKIREMAMERLKKLRAELAEKQLAADLLQRSISDCEAHSCGCQIMDMLKADDFPIQTNGHAS